MHGFRSTFKDWASEMTVYPNEMSELALAHTVSDKVEVRAFTADKAGADIADVIKEARHG